MYKKNVLGNSSDVLPLLGLPRNGHLPLEGMAPRLIKGFTIWVKPAVKDERHRHGSKHRVMWRCDICGKELSLGRSGQHIKVHE